MKEEKQLQRKNKRYTISPRPKTLFRVHSGRGQDTEGVVADGTRQNL